MSFDCDICPTQSRVYTIYVDIDTGERFEWDFPVGGAADKQIRAIMKDGVVCEVEGDYWHTRCYPAHRIHQINVGKPRPARRETCKCYMTRLAKRELR